MPFRRALAAALAAAALLGLSTDAAARRHVDGRCQTDDGWRLCAVRSNPGPRGPLYLAVPRSCHGTDNILAYAKATQPATLRRLTLRLDGVTVGSKTKREAMGIPYGIDCGALSVGTHTVSATLVRLDGTHVKVSKTFTRLDGPAPDDVF